MEKYGVEAGSDATECPQCESPLEDTHVPKCPRCGTEGFEREHDEGDAIERG